MKIQQKSATLTDTFVIGAGGHAKVVLSILKQKEPLNILVYDQCSKRYGTTVHGIKILEYDSKAVFSNFHVAIGNNQIRRRIYLSHVLKSNFLSVISNEASIAETAIIKDGVLIAPKAVVSVDSSIGIGCIINHGAIIDHDCVIGEFCHLAPNSTVLGGAVLGDNVFVGAGATILPGLKIGNNVIIGAGSVIIADVMDKKTIVGVPGKCIKEG
jgi:sugar O-acyltransferase (sialic acid O-acetyltransferase NeuD family)